MRNRLPVLPAVTAGLVIATTAVTAAAAQPSPVTAGPGAPSAVAPATRPRAATHTLTVTGTDLAGRPDTGGFVMVVNTDNSRRFSAGATFHHGTVTMRVPSGHYWAAGIFANVTRLVILPQFTVTKDATIGVDERAATSKVTVTTPRPSQPVDTVVNVLRLGASGPNSYATISAQRQVPLYVSPTTRRPTAGKLEVVTSWVRVSPRGAKGVPYRYYLERLDDSGLVHRSQNYVVRPGTLATVHARYYSDIPGTGSIAVTVGHLQLAAAARITRASVQVSFDGGKTWRAATVTGSGGPTARRSPRPLAAA